MSSKSGRKAAELLEVPAVPPLVLSRLQNFIPELQAANQKLQQDLQVRPASEFDVESVPEDQAHGYIEMDLACGLIDLKDGDAVKAAESAVAGQLPDLLLQQLAEAQQQGCSDDDDDESSSSSSGSGSDSEGGLGAAEEMEVEGADQQGASGQPGTGSGSGKHKLGPSTARGPKLRVRRNVAGGPQALSPGKKKQRPQITEL